jgi:hypothetical protein
MALRDQLISVMSAFSAASGMSTARLSTIIFNHGSKFDLIVRGADINTRSFERAMAWLSANWPEGVPWPADIQRPLVTEAAE